MSDDDSVEIEENNEANETETNYVLTERDFVAMLIDLYRNRPVLWKQRHPLYCDKRARAAALQEIVTQLKLYKDGFNENELKRKINTLRTNFNKCKHTANVLGRSPSLWYFNDLLFLDQDKEEASGELDTGENSKEVGDTSDEPHDEPKVQIFSEEEPPLRPKRPCRVYEASSSRRSLRNSYSTPIRKLKTPQASTASSNPVKTVKNVEVRREVVTTVEEKSLANDDSLEQYMTITTKYFKKKKGKEDVLAETWATKMKKLAPSQKMYAEKIINDVLFEAELGNLTKNGVSFCPNF